jgi:large subunit ribosomal protein L17
MKHRIGFNRLGRNVSHRQALYRSMATALFKYERIKTTKPKAREIRRVAEKMISRARQDTVHNRRIIARRIQDKAVLAKLFTVIGPRFKDRPGGYTRILKLGPRYGDASEMVLLELVERLEAPPRRRRKTEAKEKAESGEGAPTAEAPQEGGVEDTAPAGPKGKAEKAEPKAKGRGEAKGKAKAAAEKKAAPKAKAAPKGETKAAAKAKAAPRAKAAAEAKPAAEAEAQTPAAPAEGGSAAAVEPADAAPSSTKKAEA